MAKRLITFLLSLLMLIPSISAGTCPTNCINGQDCNDADSGCSDCQYPYWGRQCQHEKGMEYMGHKSTTETGRTCQMWSSQSPHRHSKTEPVNYCRNPDGEPAPWCFTMDSDKRYEYCGIQFCNTHCPVPTFGVFGDISDPPSTGFQVGVNVSIIAGCGPGTTGKRTCKADKTWTDAFECTTINWCPKPTLKARSSISSSQNEYHFDTELTLNCETGYEIAGSTNKIKCQEDKSWGTIPDCTIVLCAIPVLNENNIIVNQNNIYQYEDTVNIRFASGTPSQIILTCTADKSWSGNLPTCQPVCKEGKENVVYIMIGVAAGVAGLLFLEAIALTVVCVRRRKQRSDAAKPSNTGDGEEDTGNEFINLVGDVSKDSSNTYEVINTDDVYNELE